MRHVLVRLAALACAATLTACGAQSTVATATTPAASPTQRQVSPSAPASSAPSSASPATATPSVTATPSATPSAAATPTTPPTPAKVVDVLNANLVEGTQIPKVRELQARLRSAKCLPELNVTDSFGPATAKAVRLCQERQGMPVTGIVDQAFWDWLINATPKPSEAELVNHEAGRPYVRKEIPGLVKEFQHRLGQLGLYAGPISGTLDQATTDAAVAFQRSRKLPSHGIVDERTWQALSAETRNPTVAEIGAKPAPVVAQTLDPRCQRPGRTVCVSMAEHKATYLVDGKPVTSFEGRFGSADYPTYPGVWPIHAKNWTTVSTIFGERFPMPYAMFFHQDRAIHFSFDFMTDGFNGNSHGCVNMRDYETLKWLYDQLQVGDPVIIY